MRLGMWTTFDRALCVRALGHAALATALALCVMLVSDEALSTTGMRLARLCAFVPALSALGAAAALSQARARGELAALHALGVRPARAALGASIAGWLAGALALAVLLSPNADLSALFPALAHAPSWTVSGREFYDAAHGVRVDAAGAIRLVTPAGATLSGARSLGGAALCAVAPLAVALPLWISAPMTAAARVTAALGASALCIVLLHGVAAGRTPAFWLVLAGGSLGVQALLAHRGRK